MRDVIQPSRPVTSKANGWCAECGHSVVAVIAMTPAGLEREAEQVIQSVKHRADPERDSDHEAYITFVQPIRVKS